MALGGEIEVVGLPVSGISGATDLVRICMYLHIHWYMGKRMGCQLYPNPNPDCRSDK